jgi:hypothetical protein
MSCPEFKPNSVTKNYDSQMIPSNRALASVTTFCKLPVHLRLDVSALRLSRRDVNSSSSSGELPQTLSPQSSFLKGDSGATGVCSTKRECSKPRRPYPGISYYEHLLTLPWIEHCHCGNDWLFTSFLTLRSMNANMSFASPGPSVPPSKVLEKSFDLVRPAQPTPSPSGGILTCIASGMALFA